MYVPLSRSRVLHHDVCLSYLFSLRCRSDLQRQFRCNSTVVAETTSTGRHDGIDPSSPGNSRDTKNRRRNKTGSVPKENAAGEALPKLAVSSEGKALTTVKAALSKEDQENNTSSIRTGSKRREKVFGQKIKRLVEKISVTDGRSAVVDGEENLSFNANQPRIKKLKDHKMPLTKSIPGKAKDNDAKLNTASKTNDSLSSSEGISTVLARRVSSSVKNKRPRIRFWLSKGSRGSKTISLDQRTSKAIGGILLRKHSSGRKEVGELEVLTKQALITVLRANKLSPQDKKLFLGRLRHTLLSGSIKTSYLGKQSHAEGRSLERGDNSGGVRVKVMKKPGMASPKDASSVDHISRPLERIKAKPGMTAYEIETIEAADLNLVPLERPQPPVPNLAYGLERVLFNPGVYHLRDPRSRVFNFDPYLESIMPVAEFDFNALKEYITSSRDETLISTAAAEGKKYTGSTSSMTSALAHFHFLLSQWRPVNISNLSQGFPDTLRTFTNLQRTPSAIFLRWRNGTYAIDADKEFDTANILMMLGKSMEKLLTLPTKDFEKYRKENSDQIPYDKRNEAESFHYTTMGDFLMRSQLDAYDPRIPGTGMFDLKTRAVVSIRMDARNYQNGLGYEIRSRHGEFESYEREYYDMIRAAFLKYSLQVRMGRMDGVFVAFHNTERVFGFQYISLSEMDFALHGQDELTIGDSEFKLSLELLNRVLDRATAKFPEKSLRIFFETRETATPFMYIFAEPVTEDEIQRIQNSKKAEIEEYERTVLGFHREPTPEELKDEQQKADWEELQAKVEESMDNDELEILDEAEGSNEVNDHGVVVHLDGQYSLSVHEGQLDSADSFSNGHSTGLNPESEDINEDDAELVGSMRKHVKYANEIDGGELEMKPQDDPQINEKGENNKMIEGRNTIEKVSNKEAYNAEREMIASTGDPYEDSNNTAAHQPTAENLMVNASNLAGADSKSKPKATPKDIKSELLAMTLTIRNKVDGVYVVRPENLGLKDRWSVEYALAEVPKQDQARNLYEKTQRRRAMVLKRDKDEAKSSFHKSYARRLMQLSLRGRKWREEQNQIDQMEPMKVLGNQKLEAETDGLPQ